ncbi:Mut7-C RNAse domain-containing protein [Candidatus Omnitrophota bacterium]
MKFILSPELGRLSKWLRILGFDVVYAVYDDIASVLIQALRDARIILTRNVRLINKLRVGKSIQIKSDKVNQQLRQVIKDLDIDLNTVDMFSRCTICNAGLKQIDKQQIQSRVPEYVLKMHNEFFTCPLCRRIYWAGTHWGNVQRCLEQIGYNA